MNKNTLKEITTILSTHPADINAQFLEQLLTPTELAAFQQRWEIVKLLHAGTTQRDIAKQLKASLCAITRGSKELQKKNNILIKILEEKA